jgi:hypothetical protein
VEQNRPLSLLPARHKQRHSKRPTLRQHKRGFEYTADLQKQVQAWQQGLLVKHSLLLSRASRKHFMLGCPKDDFWQDSWRVTLKAQAIWLALR